MSYFLSRKIGPGVTLEKPDDGKHEYMQAISFNKEMIETLSSYAPEYLIVGTLTPPDGRLISEQKGFFYCSEKNGQYSLLDKAFNDGSSLAEAKMTFRKNPTKENKNEIKNILKNRKLILLDIVKEAWVIKGSSKDSDIKTYKADIESFKNMNYMSIKLIVANSLNAFDVLKEIAQTHPPLKKLFDLKKVVVIPQQVRGYSRENLNRPEKPIYRTDEISTATNKLEDSWKNFRLP